MNIYYKQDSLASIDHSLLKYPTQSYKIVKQLKDSSSDTPGEFLKINMINDTSPFYEHQEHSESETVSPIAIVIFKQRRASKLFTLPVILLSYSQRLQFF